MLKEQKVLREKFVDKHRQEKEANTQEQGLVVVNAQVFVCWPHTDMLFMAGWEDAVAFDFALRRRIIFANFWIDPRAGV